MDKSIKSKDLRIRVTEKEKEMLKEIAKEEGLNPSEMVRFLIRDRYKSFKK